MMKHYVIKYLLFSMLMTGTIMSVHAYTHSLDCATTEEQQLAEEVENQNELQPVNCDHCCHASAHSLGILKINPSIQFTIKTIGPLSTHLTYRSLIIGPPYHPPIFS